MSLIPFAPLYLGCSRRARPLPRDLTGHVAHPIRSIVSRLLPPRSTATSRLNRPCRSSHSLHSRTRNRFCSRILLQITSHGMNYNIATILAVIAILFVLLTYVTGAPLVPVAVILLGLAIIFGGNAFRRV